MKKLLALLLAVMMLLCACSTSPPEPTEAPTESTGAPTDEPTEVPDADSGFLLETLSDGTVAITGYTGSDAALSIPAQLGGKPVSAIAEAAFQGNLVVEDVTVPEGVVSIGDYAFECCSNLLSVRLPASLRTVGSGVFSACAKLERAEIAEGVETFGDGAFYFCRSLKEITLPASVRSVGGFLFADCSALEKAVISDLEELGERMFWRCEALKDVTLPQNLKKIGDAAFSHCTMLTAIEIPESVEEIGAYAFNSCYELTKVNINVSALTDHAFSAVGPLEGFDLPEKLTRLEASALSYQGVDTLTIPAGLTEVDTLAFSDMNIGSFVVDEGNPLFTAIDGVLFSKDETTLIAYPANAERTEYTIPDSVTTIGDCAFLYARGLTSLSIPDSVTTIGEKALMGTGLEEIVIPATVTTLGAKAFCSSSLLKAEIKAPLTVLPDASFLNCTSLEQLILPETIKVIGFGAFAGCSELMDLHLPAALTAVSGDAFVCMEHPVVSDSPAFVVEDGTIYTADHKVLIHAATEDETYTVADGVAAISDWALDCTNIKEVHIPATVMLFGENCFGFRHSVSEESLSTMSLIDPIVFYGSEGNTAAYNFAASLGRDYFAGTPTLSQTELTLAGDETAQLTIENAPGALFSCYEDDIVSVTPEGLVTAHKAGTATVYAGTTASCFKCVVTVTSDGTPNPNHFDDSSYHDIAIDEQKAWYKEYYTVNNASAVGQSMAENPATVAYKGQGYFEAMWASQQESTDDDATIITTFDPNFRPMLRMLNHSLQVELGRHTQIENVVLYSGTDGFGRFIDCAPEYAVGQVAEEPLFFSTAIDQRAALHFGNHVFILLADKENIRGGYIEGLQRDEPGGEYELLFSGKVRMKIVNAGVREAIDEDGEVHVEHYLKTVLLPPEE